MSTHLNLLPDSVQRRQAIRGLLRCWCVVGCIAVVAGVLVFIREWSLNNALERRYASKQASFDAAQQTLQDVKQLRRRLDALQGHQSATLMLAADKPPLTVLGVLAAAAQTDDGSVAIEQLVIAGGAPITATNQPSPDQSGRVELRGVATSNIALAEFVASLRASNRFTSVDLKSTAATQIGAAPARRYIIECVY